MDGIFSQSLSTTAAEHGQIAIVNWGMKMRAIWNTVQCAEFAALKGHLNLLN